jgi:spermidine synthase
MQQDMGEHKDRSFSGIVLVFIFFSGVSAIIYQIIWIREFTLLFGVHVLSVSTVLASFMAGLSIGSYLGGKIADGKIHPLLFFSVIEAGIGAYALLFPYLFNTLISFYSSVSNAFGPSTWSLQLFRFASSFVLLLIPTSLMGATLPVLSKFYVKKLRHLGNRFSLLYGANNLGALTGGFLAGFVLIIAFGLRITLYMAAAVNMINATAGLLFFAIKKEGPRLATGSENIEEIVIPELYLAAKVARLRKLLLWIFVVEGFTTLSYEVIWTRILLEFSFDKTVYLFSTIVISFIAGLALGSFLYGRRADSPRNNYSLLAMVEIWIGITSLLAFILFYVISPELVRARDQLTNWMAVSGKEYLIIFGLLLIPSTLMGVTYPLVSKIYNDNLRVIGSRIGLLGFLDTAGSIIGSFVAGFILIGFLGIYKSFMFTVLMNILAGLIVLYQFPGIRKKIKMIYSLVALVIPILAFFLFSQQRYIASKLACYPNDRIEQYVEGSTSTVTVHRQPDGYKALAINGSKTAYSNPDDLRVHRLLAYLPYFFKPDAHNAFVIGFGLGVTSATLVQCNINDVEVAELAPEVIRVSAHAFSYLNDDVLNENKLNMYYEEGRSLLFRSQEKYDIISSNAVHARLGANLYTRDFYDLCSNKLSTDGMLCQWLPTNWLSDAEFRSLIRSCTDVFPYVTLWYITRSHTLLLASNIPQKIEYDTFRKLFLQVNREFHLTDVDIYNVEMLLGSLLADRKILHEYVQGAVRNTDNFPYVEFSKVVDQKPNREVLKDLSSFRVDFDQFVGFTEQDDGVCKAALTQIKQHNSNIRKSMMEFKKWYADPKRITIP